MNNLFYVYTPFQFFVAQNIINQERLENNILILGSLKNNYFYDSYELMKIDKLWNKIYKIDKLPSYASLEKKTLLKDIIRLIKYDKKINGIIKENDINSLYLCDINNTSCRFSAIKYSRKKIKIIFFEEGISHYYSYQLFTRGGFFLNLILSKTLDVFFFNPIYHFFYAKYIFCKSLSFKEIPMNTRFSIVPVYHEQYDKQLFISNLNSNNLIEYINHEYQKLKLNSYNREVILFLSQAVDSVNPNMTLLMINVIRKKFSDVSFKKNLIVIKFHPRDSNEKKSQICILFKELNLTTYILSSEYTLPVELYLMQIKFDRIITFFSSTFLYAGYIYSKIPVDFLILDFFNECKKHHINTTNLERAVYDVTEKMKIIYETK